MTILHFDRKFGSGKSDLSIGIGDIRSTVVLSGLKVWGSTRKSLI